MTITTGETPDQLEVIKIEGPIDPVNPNFEGADAIFYDEQLDGSYSDPSTGLEEDAGIWSKHFEKVRHAAEISGPALTRRFVPVDGDWFSIVANDDPETPEIEAHLVVNFEDRDLVVADLSEESIEPTIKAPTPGDEAAFRIRRLLAKYSDDTDRLEVIGLRVAKGITTPKAYTERHSPVIEEEFGEQELPEAA